MSCQITKRKRKLFCVQYATKVSKDRWNGENHLHSRRWDNLRKLYFSFFQFESDVQIATARVRSSILDDARGKSADT